MKRYIKQLLCLFGILSFCISAYSQTSTWNGTSWNNGAPGTGTGSYSFIVNGTGCTIGDANMTSLTVEPSAACTISGIVNSTNVDIPADNTSSLTVDGTLNVNSLTILSLLNGSGTVNLSAGSYTQYDGTNYGLFYVNNFNVLSGTINIPYYISFQNMSISSGASVTMAGYPSAYYPIISGTLTINGSLTNNYAYYDPFLRTNDYFSINNLIISSTGSFNSSSGYSKITQSFTIGGSISTAGSINSYSYDFNNLSSTKILDINGNANLKFSDLSYSNTSYINLKTLNISGSAKFTVDKNLTASNININSGASLLTSGTPALTTDTLTLNSGGTVLTSGSPTITATTINPIQGSFIVPGATLSYGVDSLILSGSNASIAYLNNTSKKITLTGSRDTVRNCAIQKLTVTSGAKGVVNTSQKTYKIGNIDAFDSVYIQSLPLVDSMKVEPTGVIQLSAPVRVNHLVDVAKGGSLNSGGNLIMLDQSNLYFTDDGQIVGNILWDREYNSTGWIYFGVPFPGITPNLVSLGGFAQQPEYIKKYVESSSNPRWIDVSNSDVLSVGTGYILAMTSITNDTLVFTGNPRKVPVTVGGLTYTTTNGSWFDYQRGYNLVANPFTAPISVSGFFADNPNLSAIYYWDNNGQNNGEFVTRTSSGVFSPDISTVTAKNQTKISASYLAPNQAFFVKIPSDGLTTSVLFDTSRITRDLNDNFLKASTPSYIRLKAQNASGVKNDVVFQFNDAATSSYTPGYDFFKLVSDYYPLELYSFKGSNKYSIQTLNPDTTEKDIPIGLIVRTAGVHRFWIDNFDAVDSNINIYIHDLTANRYVNLRDSAFTVNLPADTFDNRFVVIFKKGFIATNNQVASGTNQMETSGQVSVYAYNGQIFARFPSEQTGVNIKVYDLSGRMILEKSYGNADGTISLGSDFALHKIYIVKISGDSILKISKVLVQ